MDALLEGGLYSGELIELEGEVASGKTQICLAAAATTAMNGHRVLYIDTSGSFCPNRILGLTGLDADEELDPAQIEFLSLIAVKEVFDIHGLVELLDSTYHTFVSSSDPSVHLPHLIIVDSLAAVAQPALSSQHAQGHALLSYVGRILGRIAHECALATMVTNFTLPNRQDGAAKPALGVSWSGVPSTRLWFRRDPSAEGLIDVTIVKSNRLAVGLNTALFL